MYLGDKQITLRRALTSRRLIPERIGRTSLVARELVTKITYFLKFIGTHSLSVLDTQKSKSSSHTCVHVEPYNTHVSQGNPLLWSAQPVGRARYVGGCAIFNGCAKTMNDSNGSVYSYFGECPDPLLCTVPNFEDNIPLAFGLTIAAGLATVLGAIPPLLPCIKHTNRKLLSGSLSVAAGVMLYVSFTEILLKASNNFCCLTNQHFNLATVGCFFGGILVTVVLDSLVHLLERFDQSAMKKRCFSCIARTLCKVCCKQKNKGKEKPCSDGSVSKTDKLPIRSDSSLKQCPIDMEDDMYNGDSPSISRDEDNAGEVVESSVNSSDVPHSSCVGFSDTESARVSGSANSSSSSVRRPSYLSMVENVREHIAHQLVCDIPHCIHVLSLICSLA